jgi:O-6-methylguanine DNA methyltransferase
MGQYHMSSSWKETIPVGNYRYTVSLINTEFGLNKLEMSFCSDDEKTKDTIPAALLPVSCWLNDYFNGQKRAVDFPIDWHQFTPFQRCVLRSVFEIPYGKVLTYKNIAINIGKPTAVRAVAHANGTNPLPIVIPCHRVIGSDGHLHGYSGPGDLEFKAYLLKLEGLSLEHQRVV